MSGMLSRIAQRVPRAAPKPGLKPGSKPDAPESAEQAAAALALARELLHSVEQFVISTPDLDTQRFLQRMRGTAAGLTPQADAPTIHLYRKWVGQALGAFAGLQRKYIADREEEMWRLLDSCANAAATG